MADFQALKKKCNKHGKEQILFCNESGCKTPICVMCLKDVHKGHDFSDREQVIEERCAAVLDDIRWMKETLQKKKQDLSQAHDLVIRNCEECTKKVAGVKAELINEIDKNTADLLHKITEIKKEADRRLSQKFDEIYKKLIIVNKLEKLANTKTIFDAETENLEKLRREKNEIQSWFPEVIPYIAVTYENCGSKSGYLSQLCGKLIPKNEQFQSKESISHGSPSQGKGFPNVLAKTTTSTFVSDGDTGAGENNVIDDFNKNKKTTGSYVVNQSSMDESEFVAEKTDENVLRPKMTGGDLNRASGEQDKTQNVCGPSRKRPSPLYNCPSPRSSCASPLYSCPSPSYSRLSDRCPSPSYGCPPPLYDYEMYDDVNASMGHEPASVSSTTAPDQLGSLLQMVDREAKGCVPTALPAPVPLGGGVINQSRAFEPRGRNTTRHRSKKCKSRRDDVGVGFSLVPKKARLELTPKIDSRIGFIVTKAMHSINTEFEKVGVMGLLPDASIIVSDQNYQNLRPTLKMYQAKTGKLLYKSFDANVPDGMAVVTAASRQYLALSYCKMQTIEFYDVRDIHSPVHSYSVAPDYPRRLCVDPSSPRMLVYADCKPDMQVVKWLDCSSYPPITINKVTRIQIWNDFLQEMCCIMHRQKQLLVTTHNEGGVQAYLAGTDKLEWCLSGRYIGMDRVINAVGITANGHNQLLVCDVNNGCIQMLSTDGTFLATVLRSGEQMLGIPRRMRLCRKTRSLVVAHKKESLHSISVFQC